MQRTTDKSAQQDTDDPIDLHALAEKIKVWGAELGFNGIGITDVDLGQHPERLQRWLDQGYQADMDYMDRHRHLRADPDQLLPDTIRVISARLDYLTQPLEAQEDNKNTGVVSRYAQGRDYHKLMRKRLARLARRVEQAVVACQYRAFVDSAPVLERAFAEKAGLGWIGKNTMLMNREAGSYFFLGEIYTDLPLPIDTPQNTNHCGRCTACLDLCPTKAFVEPYVLDARRCISYLTIELKGSIPEELRPQMGNRIFGCDECQAVCPWNRFAQMSQEDDFKPRHGLDSTELIELFNWSEEDFLKRTEGSAIRRTGYIGWLRNIAVALGNADSSSNVITALQAKAEHPSELVREHVAWALTRHNVVITISR